jgi:hypothetical protein
MQMCDNAVVGEKLMRYESSVRGCNGIMEQPIACTPHFKFLLNVLSQLAKNIAVSAY